MGDYPPANYLPLVVFDQGSIVQDLSRIPMHSRHCLMVFRTSAALGRLDGMVAKEFAFAMLQRPL